MSLRSIEPLPRQSLRGITPNPAAGDLPELRWVDPCDLLVDEKYQRGLSEASITLIRRIVSKFSWASFKAPVVIETAEGLKVTDGQHSAIAAATHPNIKLIPVLVSPDRTIREQAQSFLDQNVNRLGVTRTQLHQSSLTAGDEVSMHIQRIADETGIKILRTQPAQGKWTAGSTIAIGTLHRVYHSRGPAKLRVIFDLIKLRAPVTATEILALDALMHDPDYRDNFDIEAVRPVVAASSNYERHEAEGIAATHMKPRYMALAMVWYRRIPKRIVSAPILRRVAGDGE